MFKLKSKFKPAGGQPKAIKSLKGGFEKGERYQTLRGITGSGKTFVVSQLIKHLKMPVLLIAPNKSLAAQLYREYKNFFPENSVNYFVSYYDYYQPEAYMPTTDTYIDKEAMINDEIDRLRHEATTALSTRKDVIIVASVSCIYNLGLPVSYLEQKMHLIIGKPITRGDLIRQLVKIQFTRNDVAPKRGQFRVRGDVFEIMPASEEIIYRLELKDQLVYNIKIIDPITREIKEQVSELIVFPPKHFIANKPQIKTAIREIKKELKERLKYFEKKKLYLEVERLGRRTKYDMEMLNSLGYCHGVENYSRHLTGKLPGDPPETLLSYFPKGKNGKSEFLTIIDESHISVPQLGAMYEGDKKRKQTLVEYGWRLPSALDNRPLNFKELEKRLGKIIFTTATPGKYELEKSGNIVEQVIRPTGLIDPPVEVRPVYNEETGKSQVDDIIEQADKVRQRGERVIINTLTKKMAEDLSSFLKKQDIKNKYIHSDVKTLERIEILTEFREGKFDILVGVNLLREGLDLPEVSLVAILDADREGFLRSETSLMQTMGRAARNKAGKVILYADNITGSMKRAMAEVERRRKLQLAYNKKHNIKPTTIIKKVEKLINIPNRKVKKHKK